MRILSLSGGGFQALYGVHLLARLEERCGPLHRHFSRFVGTSAGAIVAAAAACEIPMATLKEGFITRGAAAFQPRHPGWGRDLLRRFRVAKYDPKPLGLLVAEIAGDHTFADLRHPLAVTATRLHDGAAVLFEPAAHPHIRVQDAVMASAAAPTMFPAVPVDGHLYTDGGVFANAPDLLAITHAIRAHPLDAIQMLSLGSMNGCPPLQEPASADMGVLDWMRGNRIFRTMTGAQAHMTAQLASDWLGDRYTRIDADPAGVGADAVGLDKATPEAIAAIEAAATASFPALDAWIARHSLA